MKPAALFCRLERLLQLHARCGDKAGARFLHRKLCELTAENLRGLEFRRAIFAARDVLLQFMPGIISQFVINIENNVLLYPFTLHSFLSTTGHVGTGVLVRPAERSSAAFIASPPVRPAISASRGTTCSWRFLRSCSTFRPQSSI